MRWPWSRDPVDEPPQRSVSANSPAWTELPPLRTLDAGRPTSAASPPELLAVLRPTLVTRELGVSLTGLPRIAPLAVTRVTAERPESLEQFATPVAGAPAPFGEWDGQPALAPRPAAPGPVPGPRPAPAKPRAPRPPRDRRVDPGAGDPPVLRRLRAAPSPLSGDEGSLVAAALEPVAGAPEAKPEAADPEEAPHGVPEPEGVSHGTTEPEDPPLAVPRLEEGPLGAPKPEAPQRGVPQPDEVRRSATEAEDPPLAAPTPEEPPLAAPTPPEKPLLGRARPLPPGPVEVGPTPDGTGPRTSPEHVAPPERPAGRLSAPRPLTRDSASPVPAVPGHGRPLGLGPPLAAHAWATHTPTSRALLASPATRRREPATSTSPAEQSSAVDYIPAPPPPVSASPPPELGAPVAAVSEPSPHMASDGPAVTPPLAALSASQPATSSSERETEIDDLYDELLRRLRADLLVDRERTGRLLDGLTG